MILMLPLWSSVMTFPISSSFWTSPLPTYNHNQETSEILRNYSDCKKHWIWKWWTQHRWIQASTHVSAGTIWLCSSLLSLDTMSKRVIRLCCIRALRLPNWCEVPNAVKTENKDIQKPSRLCLLKCGAVIVHRCFGVTQWLSPTV